MKSIKPKRSGLIFPIQFEDGAPKLGVRNDLIKSSMTTTLFWETGSRYFFGQFGSSLHRMVEKPLDSVTITRLRVMILEAISKWEKQGEITSINLLIDHDGVIYISFEFTISEDNTVESYLIPFYDTIKH